VPSVAAVAAWAVPVALAGDGSVITTPAVAASASWTVPAATAGPDPRWITLTGITLTGSTLISATVTSPTLTAVSLTGPTCLDVHLHP
jgi:hypothetical protein